MAKVTYSSLKLKIKENVKTITFNDLSIEVNQYLPIEDKESLISIVLQNTYDVKNNVYNVIEMDKYFHLYLIYLYTNISFTDKQKEDENKLYDMFKSNGLMDEIIKNIPEDEYNMLYNYLLDEAKNRIKSKRSVVGLIQSLINDLPTQAEAAKKIMDDFDPQKFQEVINFAKAANGGRDI